MYAYDEMFYDQLSDMCIRTPATSDHVFAKVGWKDKPMNLQQHNQSVWHFHVSACYKRTTVLMLKIISVFDNI